MAQVTLRDVRNDREVDIYIHKGFEYLRHLGFTEHGLRHANLVSRAAGKVLAELGYPERECELAMIAGYIHDIGNMVNRFNHGHASAMLAYGILVRLGMPPEEIALVVSAVGNHEEEYGHAVNPVAAALILADKSDVHRTRVCNPEVATFDIHDRVNYAVEHSCLRVDKSRMAVTLELSIDVDICPMMEYFEIFLNRMMMCRRAASFLNCTFELVINGVRVL